MEEVDVAKLRELFLNAWSKETCFPTSQEKWTPENPTLGQCAITALIINDMFGGEIVSNSEHHHYWNVIENGQVIDLTKDQWGELTMESDKTVSRDYILFSERAREFKTLERYQLLSKSVERQLLHVDYVPETLEECYAYLDKFLQDKSVFKAVSDEDIGGSAHHTLGQWLRNKWYLWWNEGFAGGAIIKKNEYYPQVRPALNTFFVNLGVFHPDDMSGIIIQSYHRKLNGREIEFEKQVEDTINFYKNPPTL